MKILSIIIILLISSSTVGQADCLKNPTSISEEEAINIPKREGYFLKSRKLDSNQWVVVYSKQIGFASSITPVYKNISTTIDANTGKIKKKLKFNSLGYGELANDNNPLMKFKRKKKMKISGEKITVYY